VGRPDSLRRGAADRRPRAVAPDCPEVHRTVGTGLSGVHRTDGNGRIQRSTATDANSRLTWRAPDTAQCLSGGAPDCPVHQRQKAAAFCPTTSLGIGGYKYHPNRPFSNVGAQATYQGI
jgi:hypothetical protein